MARMPKTTSADKKILKKMTEMAKRAEKKRKRRERCEDCHELFARSDLIHGSDPYAADLYGQENPCVLCVECYNDRVAEI